MSVFEQLSTNKGTVSSTLGKELAQKVLVGRETSILSDCIGLVSYQAASAASRNIRAGAAKVVEIVAEKLPGLVAPHLEELIPALSVTEPQTRWAIIRVMGFCASLNKPVAQKVIRFAEKYLEDKEGLCIASSADLFLGDLGALSKKDAEAVFPILELSMENLIANEQDWLLEACYKIYPNLAETGRAEVRRFAQHWQVSARKSTQERARKILRLR